MNKKQTEEQKKSLTPEQYSVCILRGTEPPFSGKYVKTRESGMYMCAVCNQPLFSSRAKFDSGTGWPSFDDPVNSRNVKLEEDLSHGMVRTEVTCAKCGAHLGHLFTDGPRSTTGKRYCINSLSLDFKPGALEP